MDDLPEPFSSSGEPERVRLEPVVARVSTPMLGAHDADPEGPDGAEHAAIVESPDGSGPPQLASELADRLLDVHLDRSLGLGLVIAAVATCAASIWNGDVQSGLACGVIVTALAILWIFDHRATFSFGEGFVGYRSDMGWPRGVQEDDDFRWDWTTKTRTTELASHR